MPFMKKLDLLVDVDVLTSGTAAEIVVAILETLLFQRNQIPFVYKTFRYYINKWLDQEDRESNSNSENLNLENYQVQRKKQEATRTKEAIGSMRQVIKNSFGRKPIKCLRFLFGPTIFTAKEAYTVHIPTENIADNHYHEHHKISPNMLNQTLLSLLTSEELYGVFSNNLNPTNIYLELEILEKESLELFHSKSSFQNPEIFPKELSSLPASCKDIHIYLVHKQQSQPINYEPLTCCKDLQVFEDLINLSLECNTENSMDTTIKKFKPNLTTLTSIWCEAEIVVRGFKDQPIKGFNIWN